ncbi:MAG: phosphopantetheine adenylyltransferase [Acidovorax sp.]|uniref:phosphopantetheine adenylyltransferase n=1 Tax=Acidovorax sp. TaxID=1872122 RepID=UPI0026044D69|nr:phosphopantetheine adenylyltransferase [Acidovorax sp.]MDH4464213.1 phosphopantetheine adenylyltransferase [Acidovorax sp.]
MRFVVPVILFVVAVVHALPIAGVLGAGKLAQLYGTPVQDAGTELLLRHRAVLFGLLAAFMGYAAIRPELHRPALLAGLVSMASFLVLWWQLRGSTLSPELATVARVDAVAMALLLVALAVHLIGPMPGPGAGPGAGAGCR